ncbi:hypothetical protein [Solitalea lacus]|uniref:hypothetical protein n=1 Tax=Solitalea lacus TaxID=2911172 RepID=UPI001EDA44C8|nr:hypothetical protein [Solitalea lacus]UKJ08077.1 hypothetical protein L2B55_02660 [Solitalea lacus]
MREKRVLHFLLLWICLLALSAQSCSKADINPPVKNELLPQGGSGVPGIALTLYSIHGNSIEKKGDYKVGDSLLTYQSDAAKHWQMWEYFTRLIPQEYRNKITELAIIYSNHKVAGYVQPLKKDLSEWRLALSIDISDNLNQVNLRQGFSYVLVHEFGHVLTLNDTQIDAVSTDNCTTYKIDRGCMRPESYIYKHFQLDWIQLINEYNTIGTDNKDALHSFWLKYKSNFVSEYASTSINEDIAETFAYFVILAQKPTGSTIADKKIQLMYTQPQLVDIRNRIRNNPDVVAISSAQLKVFSTESMRNTKERPVVIQ